jgi:hypothetical protein
MHLQGKNVKTSGRTNAIEARNEIEGNSLSKWSTSCIRLSFGVEISCSILCGFT